MAFHLEERLDLADGKVLSVAQGNKLVECAEQLVGIPQYLPLFQAFTCASDNLGKEVKGVDVLKNIGLAVGNEDHVQLIEGLVNEADIVLLYSRVLGPRVGELGKGREESFDTRPWHFTELSREDSFPAPGADGSGEDNLKGIYG